MLALVIGRDCNIHIGDWRVSVTEGDGGNVHVGCLLDGLMVRAGVSHNQEAGLLEVLLDLIGEGSRSVSASQGLSAKILGELIDGTLSIGASRDEADVLSWEERES